MTTTTAPSCNDVLNELADAQQALEQVQEVINEHEQAKEALHAEYNQLAATSRDQFGQDGNPKPKTRAEKVSADLGQRQIADFTEPLQYAIARVGKAEDALKRHKGEHPELWVERDRKRAEKVTGDVHRLSIELHQALREYQGMTNGAIEVSLLTGGTAARPHPTNLERVNKVISGIEQFTLDQCGGDYLALALPLPIIER